MKVWERLHCYSIITVCCCDRIMVDVDETRHGPAIEGLELKSGGGGWDVEKRWGLGY